MLIRYRVLPQSSSDPSAQSKRPLHFWSFWMQSPFLHWNWSLPQPINIVNIVTNKIDDCILKK